MKNNFYFKILSIVILTLFSSAVSADENKNINEHEFNIYTGNFDFSDDKQKAILVGFQHQNENFKYICSFIFIHRFLPSKI